MRRREFIALLGGAVAAAQPIAVRAQQPKMPVIGFLDSGSPAGMTANLAGFRRGVGESGFVEGKNVTIEFRWAEGHYDKLPALAAELARQPVDVIAATRSPMPALAAKAATSTIPIVFQTGSNPVEDGLVASLNKPGGNITGATRMTIELTPKRLGLIAEIAPKAEIIGLLVNPNGLQASATIREMQDAARTHSLTLQIAEARTSADLATAIAGVAQSGAGVLIEGADPLFLDQRQHIVTLTNNLKIPTIFYERESVVAGGLMSYSANFADSFRQVGAYVGRILKGERPADLPVQQPVKFELIINLKTARLIGVAVPQSLLIAADEVIE
jgi:putative tryptophan/tyrosine transport system substrate-binding protein